MKKRYLDCDIWEKPWFAALSEAEKLAWIYICSRCDPVGVWQLRPDVALADGGILIDWEAFPDKTNGNVEVLPSGKWWLVDFCWFQYRLSDGTSRVHASYIRMLKDWRLWELYLEKRKLSTSYPQGQWYCDISHTPKDKEQDKVKVKEQEEDKEGPLTDEQRENFQKLIDKLQGKV